MYDRRIGGKELTFGVSGKLHANSLIMYDHQTDSLWSHLAGAAVTGKMKGSKLHAKESMLTRWETWNALYPETLALTTGRRSFFGSLRDPYESYYRSSDTGIIPTRLSDKRIYPKEFVLGMVVNRRAKAYPFSLLSQKPVVNDTLEGISLLVVFDEKSATGVAFKRKVNDRTLSFRRAPTEGQGGVFLTDDATGSVWEGLTGRAVKGGMRGQRLEPLAVTPSFWFGWIDHYPDTEIYRID